MDMRPGKTERRERACSLREQDPSSAVSSRLHEHEAGGLEDERGELLNHADKDEVHLAVRGDGDADGDERHDEDVHLREHLGADDAPGAVHLEGRGGRETVEDNMGRSGHGGSLQDR